QDKYHPGAGRERGNISRNCCLSNATSLLLISITMEMFMKKIVSRRRVAALLSALVMGLARQGSAQSTAISNYNSLITAINYGITTITNFGTNLSTLPLPISLTSGRTIQITNNVTIDAGT